jgi:hypothetical protein
VSDFVEECRREWKRLRVPAGPAGEMADDLAADLHEAEAEGAFPEEVLGDGAADPRAFAAAWARERGLVRPHWTDRLRTRRSLLVGLGLVALLAVGAVLGSILSSSHQDSPPNAATSIVPTVSGIGSSASGGGFASNARTGGQTLVPAGAIIGSSILSARLLPAGVRLEPNVRLVRALKRKPTAITTTVRNSGEIILRRVTLVVQVDQRRFIRTVRDIVPNAQRKATVPLPANLPDRFTIRVFTRPVPGERNATNNSATWRVTLRP